MKSRFLDRLLTLRRFIRAIETIAHEQHAQTGYLQRLTDHFAPQPIETDAEVVKASTRISFSRDVEQAAILDYVDRVQRATGHDPTEEEIAAFLDEHSGTIQ